VHARRAELTAPRAEARSVRSVGTETGTGPVRRATARLRRDPVVLSFASRLLATAVSVSCTLVTTRLTVDALGLSTYAQINVITTLVLLLPFLDLGMGAAVTNAVATGTRHQLVAVLRTALRSIAVSATVLLAVVAVVASVIGWRSVLGLTTLDGGQSNSALLTLALLIGINAPLAVGQRVLLGLHRSHVVGALVAVQALGTVGFTWLLTRLAVPAWVYVVPMPLAVLGCSAVGLAWSCRLLDLRMTRVLGEAVRRTRFPGTTIRATAVASVTITCGTAVAMQSDRLLLAHLGTPDALAHYVIAAQIYLPVWGLVTTAGLALWPVLRQRVQDGAGLGVALLHRYIGAFFALGLACAATFLILGQPIADLVTGGRVDLPASLLWSLAALLIVQCVQFPSGMYLTGPRGLRTQARLTCLMVAVNIPLSVALIPVLGPAGPAAGSAVAVLVTQLVPTYLTARSGRVTD
jgi:O-antigen/teichoic acid export membrane protein